MQTSNDYMTKRFGASDINRKMFTDCLGGVFNMENVSDSNMQKFADDVENAVRQKHGDVADDFFELWTKDDLTDDEYDKMAVGEYSGAYETYWDVMEKLAGTIDGAISLV
jgi:hypothetical protein